MWRKEGVGEVSRGRPLNASNGLAQTAFVLACSRWKTYCGPWAARMDEVFSNTVQNRVEYARVRSQIVVFFSATCFVAVSRSPGWGSVADGQDSEMAEQPLIALDGSNWYTAIDTHGAMLPRSH